MRGGYPLSVHPRIIPCLLRRLRVACVASVWVVVSVVRIGLCRFTTRGNMLVVVLCLPCVVLFKGSSISGLLRPTLVLRLGLRSIGEIGRAHV